MKRIQLRYFTGDSAEVICVTGFGIHEAEETIGTVSKHGHLWTARSVNGANHGDRYISKWSATKQLALGLGKGEYAQ